MSFQEIRQRANRVRVIPLEDLLLVAGAARDRSDRAKWHTAQGVLSVTGTKFTNRNRGVGGGGATQTPWRGMAPGSRKDLGYFSVFAPKARMIILCESAIDALSCFALHPQCHCISTAGARPNPRWLPQLIRKGHEICCGFDADRTGDEMARGMIDLHPTVRRLRPPLHDWNDALKAQS